MKKIFGLNSIIFSLVATVCVFGFVGEAKAEKVFEHYHYDKPIITLSLEEGGNLAPTTTYYYRVATVNSYRFGVIYGGVGYISEPSEIASITTSGEERSVRIDISHSTGDPEYFMIWSSDQNPAEGEWNDFSDKNIRFLFNGGDCSADGYYYYTTSLQNQEDTTFLDNGGCTDIAGDESALTQVLLNEHAQDKLVVSGGTEEDPITLEYIYSHAVEQGWNLDETIDKLSPTDNDYNGLDGEAYILNFAVIDNQADSYFEMKDLVIYSHLNGFTNRGHLRIGEFDEISDRTSNGITLYHYGWRNMNEGALSFTSNAGSSLRLYNSSFKMILDHQNIGTTYNNGAITFLNPNLHLKDVEVSGGWNNPIYFWGNFVATEDTKLEDLTLYGNRWEGYYSGDLSNMGKFEDINVHFGGRSGVYFTVIDGNYTKEITLRGLRLYDDSSVISKLYPRFCNGATYYSKINLIDSIFDEDSIYWNIGGSLTCGDFIKRQFSFNLDLTDIEGSPLEDALVTLVNNDGTQEFSVNTSEAGIVAEQIVTTEKFEPTINTYHYQTEEGKTIYNPFILTIQKRGYQTYSAVMNIDDAINLKISLKPAPDGYMTVFGTEYASGEDGNVYVEVLDQSGTPVNNANITFTLYDEDGNVLVGYEDSDMTYISGSSGKYRPTLDFIAPQEVGVYLVDAIAEWVADGETYYSYGSGEIHISLAANASVSSTPYYVWSYVGNGLDTANNAISKVWEYASRALTSRQIVEGENIARDETLAEKVWNYTGSLNGILTTNLATALFGYTGNALTTSGNVVSHIWSYSTRRLTSRQIAMNDFIPGVQTNETVPQVADQGTQENVEYNIELVRKATFDFAGFADGGTIITMTDEELVGYPDDHWVNYELMLMSGSNFGQKRVICGFDSEAKTVTVCEPFDFDIQNGDQYVFSHERKLVHAIWNWTDRNLTSGANVAADVWNYSGDRTLTSLGSVAADVWDNTLTPNRQLTTSSLFGGGELLTELQFSVTTSTPIYEDLQTVLGRIGLATDEVGTSTVFGLLKDINAKVDQLGMIETKLDIIDSLVDAIDSAQQNNYRVELSDVGQIAVSEDYRAKLYIFDYTGAPFSPAVLPTITIYDSLREVQITNTVAKLSTGVYQFVYTVPTTSIAYGLWETVVSVDLGGPAAVEVNDYWEVEGSPAQVIIRDITDVTVPSISASVTITNEGNVGYEYQYEWCVVAQADNDCGGADDVAYAKGAKYITVGQDWDTTLSLSVPNTGDYWFKLLVYYGTEVSGASRSFTAIKPWSGSGSNYSYENAIISENIADITLLDVYSKLLDVEEAIGYTSESELDAISEYTKLDPNNLSDDVGKPLVELLGKLSQDVENIMGTNNFGLSDVYNVSDVDTSDLQAIKNKILELESVLDLNQNLLERKVNEPQTKVWFEWGSVVLKMLIVNPSKSKVETVPFKFYLPEEAEPSIIIDKGDFEIDYDPSNGLWYVHQEFSLEPGESIARQVEMSDIWQVSDDEVASYRQQGSDILKAVEKSSYFAQATALNTEINRLLDGIIRTQKEPQLTPEEHIFTYRENKERLNAVDTDMEALKKVLAEATAKNNILGNISGAVTTMTWGIILVIVVGIAVLIGIFFMVLYKFNLLPEREEKKIKDKN